MRKGAHTRGNASETTSENAQARKRQDLRDCFRGLALVTCFVLISYDASLADEIRQKVPVWVLRTKKSWRRTIPALERVPFQSGTRFLGLPLFGQVQVGSPTTRRTIFRMAASGSCTGRASVFCSHTRMQELVLIQPSRAAETEWAREAASAALRREFEERLAECGPLAFRVARCSAKHRRRGGRSAGSFASRLPGSSDVCASARVFARGWCASRSGWR